jgi:hypothetical protein
MRPKRSRARQVADRPLVAHVGGHRDHLGAQLAARAGRLLQRRVRPSGEHEPRPAPREGQRSGPPDAA